MATKDYPSTGKQRTGMLESGKIATYVSSPEITVALFNGKMEELLSYRENVTPSQVIDEFRLREPRFAEMCRTFSDTQIS